MLRILRSPALATIACLLFVSACGGGSKPKAHTTPTPKRTIVNVTLQEYAVLAQRASAPAGLISFQPKNIGPQLTHQFVIVKTSLAPDKLPKKANGSVDETNKALTAVGKIEKIPVGSTAAQTFTLTPGRYVLFCNLVLKSGSTTLAHYKLGMRTSFTVT